jgi:2-dehydropantoate 2-reductase
MRILVVGAGAIGGYFGGRLLQAGEDVTFLVRPRRAAELAATGLMIHSRKGDAAIPRPPLVLAEDLHTHFDLVLLACKAYDLQGAVDALAPAVGPKTAVLPLLNGMKQLDLLEERFGPSRVLGGLCKISTSLDGRGQIVHYNNLDLLAFGEREAATSARAQSIAEVMARANFQTQLSPCIVQEMWEKWIFIAACAGITCLMRAPIGDVVAAGAGPLALTMLGECAAVASAEGYAPRAEALENSRSVLVRAGSPLAASMLRDIERQAPVEGEHILGDLMRRGAAHQIALPALRIAYVHLKAYESRRMRESSTQP